MKIQEFRRQIYQSKINRPQLFAYAKSIYGFEDLKKVIRLISSHSQGKYYLESSSLPKSYASLRKGKILKYSNNLVSEITWVLWSIKKYSKEIDKFLLYKSDFENALLLERYEDAKLILTAIEKEVCYSNWTLENRLLLAEKKDSTEANWLELNKLSSDISDSLMLFLAEQSSKKAEDKFSYSGYRSNFESIISSTNDSVKEYLCFKLLYPGYEGFKNYGFYVNIESVSSVIDRYIMLCDVLPEFVYEEKIIVRKIVNDLSECIKFDQKINNIINILNEDYNHNTVGNKKLFIEVLDQYTKGDYELALVMCQNEIASQPSVLEYYVIYAKSLVELGRKYTTIKLGHTIDSIIKILHDIFSINSDFNNSVEDGFKISLQLFSHDIGKQLSAIIGNYVMLRKIIENESINYYVNSKYLNPGLIGIYNNKERISASYKYDNISIEVNRLVAIGDFKEIMQHKDICEHKRVLYIVRSMHQNNKIDSIIELHESGKYNISSLKPYSKKEYYEIVYYCYYKNNQIDELVNHFVKVYFDNVNYVVKLDREFITENENFEVLSTIESTVASRLSGLDNYNIYVHYDNFLESKEVEKPLEIDWYDIKKENKEISIFFLHKICTIDVMQYSVYYDGTDDIETHRINILKLLLNIDDENTDTYIQEISDITRKSKVRSLIRDVNKGRITVNIEQIKIQELNLMKDKYARFIALQDFTIRNDTKVIDSTSKMLSDYFHKIHVNLKNDKSESNIKNDPAYAFYKLMFLELRDKFLFSKDYGLEGYLSTRIRHGTLENHLRSVFETQNLLFQSRDDKYVSDNYWTKSMNETTENDRRLVEEALNKFTVKVDTFTQNIVRDYIQIVTERKRDKERGLFDFQIPEDHFRLMYEESNISATNHTSLLNYIFDILESFLMGNLSKIRLLINTQIKDIYLNFLDELRDDLEGIDTMGSLAALSQSISRSQTDLINELNQISEWFNLSNPTTDSILDIGTVIETALKITNTIYPSENLAVKIEDLAEVPFAVGTTNMIYICRIIFDNIIKHSGLSRIDRNVKAKAEIIGTKTLALSFTNDIDENVIDKTSKSLSKVKEEWDNNKTNYDKINTEGGSGYDKIRKMMAIDMQMDKYDFNYKLNGNSVTVALYFSINLK